MQLSVVLVIGIHQDNPFCETCVIGQEKKCRKTGAVVCLLKVARKQKLIPALDAVVDRPGCIINVPSKLLMSAAFSSSEELHMSVLELACIHPK